MKELKVSIITPTYNRCDLIVNAIESVLKQTHKNIELIIVDDNPPDSEARKKTKAIVNSIKDERIRYIENEKNSGPSISRNNGIAIATGEYISFLDDDDEYIENKVEAQLAFMVKHNLDLCFCDGAIYDTNGILLSVRKKNLPLNLGKNELMKKHMIDHLTGTNKMMFKASFLHKVGGFDNVAAAEEYYLTEKSINAGARLGNVEQPLTKTILHGGKHITTSRTKIVTENQLYDRKKEYFHILSKKELRKVKVRHYATLAFANLKCKLFFACIYSCFKGMLVSPIEFIKIAIQHRKKL